jgi:stress-induced morphogen
LSISVGPSEDEQRIGKILRNEFHPTELEVRDISGTVRLPSHYYSNARTDDLIKNVGGCGSMYQISITSKKFEGSVNDFKCVSSYQCVWVIGRRLVQQHRMVKDVLKEEIEKMHGYTLITLAPS